MKQATRLDGKGKLVGVDSASLNVSLLLIAIPVFRDPLLQI